MLKLAQYRRNGHPNSGFKEKLAWQLSKGPATGRELSALFNMSLSEFNSNMYDMLHKPGETLKVSASDPVKVGPATDHTYTMTRKPRRIVPRKDKNECVVSLKQMSNRNEEARQQCIEAAKRRARLIKAGFNPGCLE